MTLQKERKTIVPWFSMAEWDLTYKNIYSADTELQLRGYERLLVWKARCPRLPIGVECTMGMLQVLIKDQELVAQIDNGFMQPYQEHDLRLLYSTSVMRFLNQIAVLAQSSSETLYQAARKMYVPDWLVSLRHDIAHGATLPPLSLLRKAAQFSLTWLHEYYWKGEAAASADFVATESELVTDDSEDLKELFEMWQAIKLYSLSEYEHLGQIPDGPLRKYLRQITKSNKKRRSKSAEDKEGSCDIGEKPFISAEISNKEHCRTMVNVDESISLKNAAACVKEKLLAHIKRNKSVSICDQVVELLLNGHVFIPSSVIWNMFGQNHEGMEEDLVPWLIEIWSPMLNSLQQNLNILPTLLCHLASVITDTHLEEHQNWVAALWMKQLLTACIKARLVLQIAYSRFSLAPGTKISKELWNKAERLVVKKQPGLGGVMTLKMSEFPDPFLSVVDVKEILLSPSKWTHIFLKEMLELLNLPARLRENLISLVSIYTQDFDVYDVDTEEDAVEEQVHTVSELLNHVPETMTEKAPQLANDLPMAENSTNGTFENWKKNDDNHNWNECPLGVLPWQKEKGVLLLDFDSSVSWNALKLQQSQELKSYNRTDLPKQIAWDKVLKRRIRKGRVTKRKRKINILKNAFQMVYSAV